MVTEILETARLKSEHDQSNREKTNLAKLIQGSCLAFMKEHVPGIRFESVRETCQAFVDAEQIQTVLKNLLANALKYSNAENAPVGISVSGTDSGTHIEIQDHGKVFQKKRALRWIWFLNRFIATTNPATKKQEVMYSD